MKKNPSNKMRRFARETRLEPIIVRPLGEINVRERDAASSAVPGFFPRPSVAWEMHFTYRALITSQACSTERRPP